MTWLALLLSFVVVGMIMMGCCAAFTCDIFSDDFSTDRTGSDYTTVSGTPSVGSGVLTTTSTGFLIVENTAGSTGHGNVTAKIKASATGATVRVVGSYVSSSQYLFPEVLFNGASSSIILYSRVSSVDTPIGTTTSVTLSLNTFYDICLSWNGVDATAHLSVPFNPRTVSGAFTGTGNKAGLGASANGGTVTFDDFVFTKHKIDDSSCPQCASNTTCGCSEIAPTHNCAGQIMPDNLLAHLSFTRGTSADLCVVPCDGMNGASFVLTRNGCGVYHVNGFSFSVWLGAGSSCDSITIDESCAPHWDYDVTQSGVDCDGSPGGLAFNFRTIWDIYLVKESGNYYLYGLLAVGAQAISFIDRTNIILKSASLGTSAPSCPDAFAAGITLTEVCRTDGDQGATVCPMTAGTVAVTIYNL